MTLDIIEVLKQKVSAMVLDGEKDYVAEKGQALAAFYPILLTLLKSKPNLIQGLQNQLNPKLTDLFQGHGNLKQQLLQHLSPTIPIDQTEAVLNRAISPTLNVLENEAGTADNDGIGHFLATQWANIQRHLPSWALPLLAGLGITTATAHSVPPTSTTPVPPAKEEKKSGFLLPLIAFLILAGLLAFLFKSCNSDKKVEPTTAATQATTEPAYFKLNTTANGDLANCQVALNNPTYLEKLQQQVKQVFNASSDCKADTSTMYAQDFVDQAALSNVLNHVKGIPNTQLEWKADQLIIQSANPKDAEGLAAKIKPLLNQVKLAVVPAVGAVAASEAAAVPASTPAEVDRAVNDSITQAGQALSSINPNNVTASDIAKALNLQIINFATASSAIPESNKVVLDQAAELMKNASHVTLTVEGHTDTVGSAAANKTLSLQRAQAVAKYLVAQGVNPAQLKAVGFGQENPVADNNTEAGKFKNRRIEFKVVNTETGTVRTVDNQGVTKQQ